MHPGAKRSARPKEMPQDKPVKLPRPIKPRRGPPKKPKSNKIPETPRLPLREPISRDRSVLALGKPVEKVIIDEVKDGNIKYWRDNNSNHHVPKRSLGELIVKI